jgi:hypothetical protein
LPDQTNNLTIKAMRTLLFAFLAGILSISAEARPIASQLNIRLTNYGNYTVMFNNTTYFATERVRIFNIQPGKHYLRIVETLQPRYNGSRSVGKRVIYEGYVTIPPRSAVFSTAGTGCGFEVARIDRFDNGHGRGYSGYNDDRNDDRYNDGRGYDNRNSYNNGNYGGGYNGDGNSGGGNGGYDDGTYGDSRIVAKPDQNKDMARPTDNIKKKK